jgi:hypothetical protein
MEVSEISDRLDVICHAFPESVHLCSCDYKMNSTKGWPFFMLADITKVSSSVMSEVLRMAKVSIDRKYSQRIGWLVVTL